MINQGISSIASYKDESLLLNHNKLGVDLLLQIDENTLTYALFDKSQKKILSLEKLTKGKLSVVDLCNYLVKEKLSEIKINEIRIAITTFFSTLFPESLYRDDKKVDLLCFNFNDLPKEYNVYSDKLIHINSYQIYAVSNTIQEAIAVFKNAKTYHFATPLLESFAIHNPSPQEKSVIIHIQPEHFELAIFSSRKLLLYNSHKYKTPEDIAYFTLFTLEQLKIHPLEVNAIFAGEAEKKSEYFNILYKYIKHLKTAHRPKGIAYSYVLDEVPAHFYYLLFNLLMCE
jgi:hypothetical protein